MVGSRRASVPSTAPTFRSNFLLLTETLPLEEKCDHNLIVIFTDVVAKWLGSTHDTAIYNSPAFKKRIEGYLEE